MFKAIFYFLSAVIYIFLIVEYIKLPLLKLLSAWPGALLEIISGLLFLPFIILIAYSYDAYDKRKQISEPKLYSVKVEPFTQLWAGDMPMWSAFWGYHTTVNIFSFFGSYAISRQLSVYSNRTLLMSFSMFIVFLGYLTLTTLGTWRSSNRYTGPRIWVVCTRIGLVFSTIFMVFFLLVALLGIKLFQQA